jgi:hypothetical protein
VDAVAGYDQTRQHAWTGEGKAPWLVAFAVVRLAERLCGRAKHLVVRTGPEACPPQPHAQRSP